MEGDWKVSEKLMKVLMENWKRIVKEILERDCSQMTSRSEGGGILSPFLVTRVEEG